MKNVRKRNGQRNRLNHVRYSLIGFKSVREFFFCNTEPKAKSCRTEAVGLSSIKGTGRNATVDMDRCAAIND